MIHSEHSRNRASQRGVTARFIEEIFVHADVEHPVGNNCTLLRVSRRRSAQLNIDDRLGHYALIWSYDTARIVTVMPLHDGPTGRRYRRKH